MISPPAVREQAADAGCVFVTVAGRDCGRRPGIRSVGHAQRERLTTAAELDAVLRRPPKRRGAALLRQVIGGDTAVTWSQAEERLLALVRSARLPAPRVNAYVAGHLVDFHWLRKLRFHAQRDRFENDRARDHDLAVLGP